MNRLVPAGLAAMLLGACISSTVNPVPTNDAGIASFDAGGSDAAQALDTSIPTDAAQAEDSAPVSDGTTADVIGSCSGPGWVDTGSGCVLNLQSGWTMSTDANTSTSPVVSVTNTTFTSVTVHSLGGDGSQCGCNAEHLIIPLGKSFPCATTTLEFDYTTNATPTATSSPSVDIHFCSGTCGGSSFYGGPRFMGSEATGHSNCAVTTSNQWPAQAQVKEGHNTIALGSLVPATNGSCSGSFDTLDVHVADYACYAAETATSTLSNVTVH